MEDNKKWSEFLDEAFGAQESIPQEPSPQSPASQEEQILTPSEETPPVPRRKRRLWPAFAITAVLVAVAVLLFLPRETPSPELQMCKDALEQWQSYDSYHIIRTAHHYGDTLGSIGQSEHLGIGNNRIYVNYNLYAETPGLYAMMQKNGQYYEFHSDSITAGKIFPWEEANINLEVPTPWPIDFIWEDDKVLFKEAQYYPSGAVKQVTVTVMEQDPENLFYSNSPYNVSFSFSESGYVTTVTQYLVDIRDHYTAELSVVTFAMLNANAQSIEDAFIVPVLSIVVP